MICCPVNRRFHSSSPTSPLLKNLKSSKRGAAGGPSDMTRSPPIIRRTRQMTPSCRRHLCEQNLDRDTSSILIRIHHIWSMSGVRLLEARRRQERSYPEFVAPRSCCCLVVLSNKVGGRPLVFSRPFVQAKVRSEPPLLQMRAQQIWKLRWVSIIACASACAVLVTLGSPSQSGTDDVTPYLHEIEGLPSSIRPSLILLCHSVFQTKRTNE